LRQGLGTLVGKGRVVIKNGETSSVITATSIILATGSKPSLLPSISGDRVATTDTALHWDTLPASLLIIGGGIIGIEFACMMQAFGVTVTIVEKLPHLLAGVDAEIAEAMRQLMVKRGVTIHTDVEAREFVSNDQGCRAILSNGTTIQAERTLVSVGRTPLTAGLGLETVGLTTDRGFLRVGDDLRAAPGIFCVGDANGRTLLAHAASAQGKVAAANALGANHLFTAAIPSAIYTFPEISAVGLTEAQAKAKNLPIVIGKYPFRGHAKAMATGDTDGFVKVIRHAGGELLGVHALGHSAIEFGAAALAMLNTKSSAEDLASLAFAHPSMSEALGEAADDSYARALHLPPRKAQAVLA
jgi:dihydrolipoamide dehydrogenase